MVSKKWLLPATIVSALLFHSISAHFLCGQNTIPDTVAGNALSAVIESTNTSDEAAQLVFFKEGFATNDDDSVKRRIMQTSQIQSQLGGLTFKKIVNTSERSITAVCETANGPSIVLTITLGDEPPHKIQSIAMELGGDEDAEVDGSPLDAAARTEIVDRLCRELRSKYVFPEVSETMIASVEKSAADGSYDEFESATEFASQLSNQLREICNDKHLRVRAGAPRHPGATQGRRPVDNHGFIKAEALPGGIGYLKFNYFAGEKVAQDTAAAAMNFLGNSEALIFDLRENGGGSPEMIAFLSSYLFDEPVHLNSFYNRPTETTTESWTQKEVPGKKFSPETPVYVLTSNYTFSGAEEFSYNLKNLQRGTIVGETTGGGAHPVMPVTLGKRMHITMPFARAINPITETNWEGVGVQPDIEVAADQALEKAIELARARIAERANVESRAIESGNLDEIEPARLLEKANQLIAEERYAQAIPLLAELTQQQPDNGEAWYKYGLALHLSGETDLAIDAHKKAVAFDEFASMAHYNLACAYSLKSNADDAFIHLEKAISMGAGSAGQLESDSDFDKIRSDPRFVELLKTLKDRH